jgi:predicted GNAT family N-acyltransferase
MFLESKYVISKITTQMDLYYALGVRSIVFIKEQKCPFVEEFDNLDILDFKKVQHFIVKQDNAPVGTARVIFKNDTTVKIGRIALLKEVRSQGLGTYFISHMLNFIKNEGYTEVIIGAQQHLENYYATFGFKTRGEMFYEAGIKHVEMTLTDF